MELYILRHGETDLNKEHILQGISLVSHLDGKGKEQVINAGKKLKNIKFDHIYSSDLLRTKETTDLILKELDYIPSVTYTDKLRERNHGDYEGHTWEYVRENINNEAFRSIIEAPPNGESLFDIKKRVDAFIEEIKNKYYSDEKILVVTHNGTIIMMFLCLLELGFENHKNFHFNNGSISQFHIGNIYNKLVLANWTPNCS